MVGMVGISSSEVFKEMWGADSGNSSLEDGVINSFKGPMR
jgi:hypothetical protein